MARPKTMRLDPDKMSPELREHFEKLEREKKAEKQSANAETEPKKTKIARRPKAQGAARPQRVFAPHPKSQVADLLGPPCLLPQEDGDAYHAIEGDFFKIIAPSNIIEAAWVRELTDGVWQERRLNQAKSASLKLGARQGYEATLNAILGPRPFFGASHGEILSIDLMKGKEKAQLAYESCAKKIGITQEDEIAVTFVERLKEQLSIQSAIDNIRRQRASVLAGIAPRRKSLATLLEVAAERAARRDGGSDGQG